LSKSPSSGGHSTRIPLGGGFDKKIYDLKYHLRNFSRAYSSWVSPYLTARIHHKDFFPFLSFLYTDLKCNLDCHYCYSRGKKIPGMTMQTAKDAVEWLHKMGCRVLAYMGGEPLVRKDFIIQLTRFAVDRGFFVYLPTNGLLLDKDFIDAIGNAGVATINLAVDAVDGYKGIPKYFTRIKNQLEYLVHHEKRYNYITFLNINITQENHKDVRELTEIAHEYGIATDYHINEPPPITYENFQHEPGAEWFGEDRFEEIDALIDWLIEKNIEGYTMVNSIAHLSLMKKFIRHKMVHWPCLAGKHSMVIRLDGSFAPCFELYGSMEDWGNIYEGAKFDTVRLEKQKQLCSPQCLSTCNFQLNHYSQSIRYSLQWAAKHAYGHFFGKS
jgi:MoaA/NifB/PqqE/SkfB family radical SAM enzyme